jgi:hypothetical protein
MPDAKTNDDVVRKYSKWFKRSISLLDHNPAWAHREFARLQGHAYSRMDSVAHASRLPRFAQALALPMGIFGTFLGIFNSVQIAKLRTDLKGLIKRQNQLIEVVQSNEYAIQRLDLQLADVAQNLATNEINNPAYLISTLSNTESFILHHLTVATNTIQQAQNRRLAVDFLQPSQLRDLFSLIQEKADLNKYTLLTEHHSDLFQLEVSYFYDLSDVHLIVHVPMIPESSLLTLYRLHKFPLPLSHEHMLIPSVDYDVLGLAPGVNRLSTQINYVDLMQCHNVNNIYLCDKQGVLRTSVNSTCLGSLYLHDFEQAQHLCPFHIYDSGEIVRQLTDNWFLIYSPQSQMAPITCSNGSHADCHVPAGVSRLYVSSRCRTQLKSHLLISDVSLRVDTDLMHFEWNWNDDSLYAIDRTTLDTLTNKLQSAGIANPSIHDLRMLQMHETPTLIHRYVNTSVTIAIIIAVVSLISYLGCCLKSYLHKLMPSFLNHYVAVDSPANPPQELQPLAS